MPNNSFFESRVLQISESSSSVQKAAFSVPHAQVRVRVRTSRPASSGSRGNPGGEAVQRRAGRLRRLVRVGAEASAPRGSGRQILSGRLGSRPKGGTSMTNASRFPKAQCHAFVLFSGGSKTDPIKLTVYLQALEDL